MISELRFKKLEERIKLLETALLKTQTVEFNMIMHCCRLGELSNILGLTDEEIGERFKELKRND